MMDLQGFGGGCKTFIPTYLLNDINKQRQYNELEAVRENNHTLAYEGMEPYDLLIQLFDDLGTIASFQPKDQRFNLICNVTENKLLRYALLKLISHCIEFICKLDYDLSNEDDELERIIGIANGDIEVTEGENNIAGNEKGK